MANLTPIDTACALLEIGGWRLVTDPVFDAPKHRYHFGWGALSTKTGTPALPVEALGAVDAQKASADLELSKQVAGLEHKVRNLFDAVGKLGLADSLNAAIKEAEAEAALAAVREKVAKAAPAKVIAHPPRIRAAIQSILDTLSRDPQRTSS